MPKSNQPSPLSRILFWVLGLALFLTLALLPNLLLTWFYTGGVVHAIVVPTAMVILALIWGTSRLTAAG